MHKIKAAGAIVFVLSTILALLFNTISKKNSFNNDSLSIINEQKSYTQEISKAVLYLSKNRGSSTNQLDANIENFLANMKHERIDSSEHATLVLLWKEFYADVKQFRENQKITTAYNSILTDTLVNNIYIKNQKLIVVFNTFIHTKEKQNKEMMQGYKKVQYVLFTILGLLLIYLFTQIRQIIVFIQKFSNTSKSIIQKASIRGLKPIPVKDTDKALYEATQNFNQLVQKIDSSISYAQESVVHTVEALEEVEAKIEDLMTLISQMQEKQSDVLYQKEDAVIEALETLMSLTNQLKNLQQELNKLTSSNDNH